MGVWVGGAVTFVRRGLDAELRVRPAAALAAGVAFALGVAVFLVGLRLA